MSTVPGTVFVDAIKDYHSVMRGSLAGRHPHFLHHYYEETKNCLGITVGVIVDEIKKQHPDMTPEQENELSNIFLGGYEDYIPSPL